MSRLRPVDSLSAYRCKVETMVRALLLANKGGLFYPEPFLSEYRAVIGEDIDFRRLGRGSVIDLLADMPDTVAVRQQADDGRALLEAVADGKTRHIQQMVRKQKASDTAASRMTKSEARRAGAEAATATATATALTSGERKQADAKTREKVLAVLRQVTARDYKQVGKEGSLTLSVMVVLQVYDLLGRCHHCATRALPPAPRRLAEQLPAPRHGRIR